MSFEILQDLKERKACILILLQDFKVSVLTKSFRKSIEHDPFGIHKFMRTTY